MAKEKGKVESAEVKGSPKLGIPPYEYTKVGKMAYGRPSVSSRIARSKKYMKIATDPKEDTDTKQFAFRQSKLESTRARLDLMVTAAKKGDMEDVYAHKHNIEVDMNPLMYSGRKNEDGTYEKLKNGRYVETGDRRKKKTA